jgi:hypothetical protein
MRPSCCSIASRSQMRCSIPSPSQMCCSIPSRSQMCDSIQSRSQRIQNRSTRRAAGSGRAATPCKTCQTPPPGRRLGNISMPTMLMKPRSVRRPGLCNVVQVAGGERRAPRRSRRPAGPVARGVPRDRSVAAAVGPGGPDVAGAIVGRGGRWGPAVSASPAPLAGARRSRRPVGPGGQRVAGAMAGRMLRHTAAMTRCPPGRDSSVVDRWRRHESVQTTQSGGFVG